MRIDPRKSEWQPVVDLLESGEFDGPIPLAKAIVKQAYETLLDRDWFLTVVKLHKDGDQHPLQIAYGLFASEAEAHKVGQSLGRPYMVLSVASGGTLSALMKEAA